jgi:cell wall assembly regulator SMI1
MSSFADIFDATARFLQAKGISPRQSKPKKASPSAVARFCEQTDVALPESFSAFYVEFADGYEFRWQTGESAFGVFSIPSLKQLARKRRDWERYVLDFLNDPDSLDRCMEPRFRERAFEIWRTMKGWVPFWDEGNGDHFCVDTAGGQIGYDQHDWFDGFGALAKINGILAGENLTDFLQHWSQFCFQPTNSLWWGEFGEFGAIQWKPEYFQSEFFRGR